MPSPQHPKLTVARRRALAWLCCLGVSWVGCDDFEPPPSEAPTRVGGFDAGSLAPTSPRGSHDEVPVAPAIDASVTPVELPGSLARASRTRVLVANPREGSVAVIDPETLAAAQLPCARTPSLLAASERADLALAIDVAERTACVLELGSEGTGPPVELPIVAHVNAVALSLQASFAVVYHDRAEAERTGQRAVDTVEVTVVQLTAPARAANVLVGPHPRAVVFSSDGASAFVTSDAGVAMIALELAAAGELGSALPRGVGRELFVVEPVLRVAPDAARAVAFEPDGQTLLVTELRTGVTGVVDLARWAELVAQDDDAGVAIDGLRIADVVIERAGARAFVALRGEQTVLELPLPEAIDQPLEIGRHALPGQPSERLALSGADQSRLLVLAAAPQDGRATLVPIAPRSGSLRVPLVSAPSDVLADETGTAFVLLHGGAEDEPAGYSVVRALDGLARHASSAAPPIGLSFSLGAGALAAITTDAVDGRAALERVELSTLAVTRQPLEGTPLTAGFARGGRDVYAQLEHPDGRLVFFDRETGTRRTATGFLIAERVGE